MTRAQMAQLAEALRRTLAALEAEEVRASISTKYRLQGAIVALDVVLNERSSFLKALEDGVVDLEGLLSRTSPE